MLGAEGQDIHEVDKVEHTGRDRSQLFTEVQKHWEAGNFSGVLYLQ